MPPLKTSLQISHWRTVPQLFDELDWEEAAAFGALGRPSPELLQRSRQIVRCSKTNPLFSDIRFSLEDKSVEIENQLLEITEDMNLDRQRQWSSSFSLMKVLENKSPYLFGLGMTANEIASMVLPLGQKRALHYSEIGFNPEQFSHFMGIDGQTAVQLLQSAKKIFQHLTIQKIFAREIRGQIDREMEGMKGA